MLTLISKRECPSCDILKEWLDEQKIDYKLIVIQTVPLLLSDDNTIIDHEKYIESINNNTNGEN